MLYWYIGRAICLKVLDGGRASYGDQIVASLGQQLSWTHFRELITIDDPIKRRKELDALKSNGPISHDLVFRDPYVLDFLGLHDTYSEQDMESAIIQQLQRFIIELGTDFAFLARQKRITIDNEDFKIDLLFYHRGLRRLVAIDLKLGKFKAAYKGQMELYLRWLDKYERREGEDSPLGLILCSEKRNYWLKNCIPLLKWQETV